jgi:hypothetical protein
MDADKNFNQRKRGCTRKLFLCIALCEFLLLKQLSKPFFIPRRGAERFRLVVVALLSGNTFFYHEGHEEHEGLV